MYLQHLTIFDTNVASFYFFNLALSGQIPDMVAYEFYWGDGKGKEHFIGILPERRRKTRENNSGVHLELGMEATSTS